MLLCGTLIPNLLRIVHLKSLLSFELHPGGNAVPLLLNTSQKIFDGSDTHIGFVSFDEDRHSLSDTLYCGLIGTLWEGSTGVSLAFATSIAPNRPGRANSEQVPDGPILAYGLLLKATNLGIGEYRRVGIVQVKYEWIANASQTTIRLI